ncbi:hypothetical protein Daura_32500 [Dactylosporangium aurantiacum]|uniref:Uncharacterized protein n=1 Tax=Dactylosporangium aurantiacum TaxID=35754 RepID=A0A9Q9IAH8_9ACTN|nr:hypothetical protein [Dactylosporangium aurantiacum]MDG6107162.1 hypothetical protein [Dactylosporangium aurantiacum]UWZ51456.1 hypothetical protein Daura_32500 [Dactylosporangium aurantiacum]
MSEYGDTGYDGGDSYGHYDEGQDHQSLDQLHQIDASQENYDSQFGVYEADHNSAEATSFDQGHSVEFTGADGSHYAEQDFTSYDHSAAESDHVFAAEGSESYDASEYHQLDALQARLDSAFASATEINTVSA